VKPVVVQTDIPRAAEDVFAVLDDVEQNPHWLQGMVSSRWTTDSPPRVGSRYEQLARFMGREIRTSFEVTARVPGRLVTIESRAGSSFPLTVTREVVPTGPGRCRAVETVLSSPEGFYRIATPLLRLMVRRNIARDYRRFRDMMQSGALPVSATA